VEAWLLAGATVVALLFRPWSTLRHMAARGPWIAPAASDPTLLLTAGVMIAWGEAFATGALTAIFVAYRPEWLLTYSDARYLPRPEG
jgi:uncharacterized membrane protein